MIAIKLHRQALYREDGLQIFEQLLALNLRGHDLRWKCWIEDKSQVYT